MFYYPVSLNNFKILPYVEITSIEIVNEIHFLPFHFIVDKK